MQYHASLITADGAYHCPVGRIMAIFAWNVGWLRETDRHCHLLSCSGQLTRSHGGNMTFIARFVHIKQVKGKIKFGQKNAISYTDGTQDGNGSN